MSDCPFCAILASEAPALFVTHWRDAIAIVPINPVTEGHVLVIPRDHVESFASWPEISGAVMRRAAEYAQGIGDCNIITSVGPLATQAVKHLHVHVEHGNCAHPDQPRRPPRELLVRSTA